jgi:hypothetical protein
MPASNDIVHKLIFAEASKFWKKFQRNSLWFKILNYIFRSPRPNALYIQEYSDADWDKCECKGNIIETWILDVQGFRNAEAPALDPESHKHFERLAFCSDSKNETALMIYYYSPFGGFGLIFQAESHNGKDRIVPKKNWIF